MAKPRVHEIAAEMGVESKVALATLQEMGEFVKTASSSVEPPVARRLRDELKRRAEQGGAERAQMLYPWPRPASSPGMQEALIDQVVERVIARLSDGVTDELVTDVVARVAEKLVREELERSKQA